MVVGYHFCARHGDIAHVARLAVHPAWQGQGVASLLLHDLLSDLLTRDFREVTVNTQRSNLRSQRLYARFGFMRSGKDYPLWHKTLATDGAGISHSRETQESWQELPPNDLGGPRGVDFALSPAGGSA